MKACWISKCIPKNLSICTHYVNWYSNGKNTRHFQFLKKNIHTWCMQATEKKLKKQNNWEVSRKVHKSQFSSDTFSHLDLFWPQQRNTTNVKPLIYVCNVRGKPREITFYGQQLYLQDSTAFSVPCALHILFYDTLNVAPNRCWIIQIGFGFLSFQDNHRPMSSQNV